MKKKIIIVLAAFIAVSTLLAIQYDKMYATVDELLGKYSVETVIDRKITTRNFLIKYATPLDIVRAYNIIKNDGEDVFLQKLIEIRQTEVETPERIRIVTRVPLLNETDEPLKTEYTTDNIKNMLMKNYEYPGWYRIHSDEVDITDDFIEKTADLYENGDWAAIFTYIRNELKHFTISGSR